MTSIRTADSAAQPDAAPSVPELAGAYVGVYAPAPDVYPGPDSEQFRAGRRYARWVANDHCFVKGPDDCWHAFGITHPQPAGYSPPHFGGDVHEAEWLLFHAVAPPGRLNDHLRPGAWRDAAKVLAPGDRSGEIAECHAPYIVAHDGRYLMVYGPDPLRLAISDDLYHWQPAGALFHQPGGARDPHLLWHDGRYVLSYCTRSAVFARWSTDLRTWSAEPVELHRLHRGGDPESPCIVARDGWFYLFYCLYDADDQVNGAYDYRTFVHRSADPLDFRDAPCVAQLPAHAPEVVCDEDGDWYLSSVEWPRRGVSLARLTWEPVAGGD